MAEKDPAFLFYPEKFISGVQIMNFEDRGKLITLLSLMHQQGRMNEETIRFLVGSVSDMLKSKFKVDEHGFWYNEKLEKEIGKRRNFIDSRRGNGVLGGRPKKDDDKLLTKPSGYPLAKPNGYPLGGATDNLPINTNINTDLSTGTDKSTNTNTDANTNTNTLSKTGINNTNTSTSTSLEEKKVLLEKRSLEFKNTLNEFRNEYQLETLRAFYSYWSEPNKSFTKMKYELQETWDTGRRLATWAKREKTMGPAKNEPKCQLKYLN